MLLYSSFADRGKTVTFQITFDHVMAGNSNFDTLFSYFELCGKLKVSVVVQGSYCKLYKQNLVIR